MKFILPILTFALLIFSGVAFAEVEIDDFTLLTVNVTGFDEIEGSVRLALYDSEEGFASDLDAAVYSAAEPVTSDTVTFTFDFLPRGVYAFSVYHDEDDDGELDMKFYGPPSEKVGASNNATGRMGPPSFEDASFILGSERVEMTIEL